MVELSGSLERREDGSVRAGACVSCGEIRPAGGKEDLEEGAVGTCDWKIVTPVSSSTHE